MDGAIVGLDVGDRRIGIAVSDAARLIASPHSVLNRTQLKADIAKVMNLVEELGATEVVAGGPLQPNGQPGAQAHQVQRFLQPLSKSLGYEIHLWDERMTSIAAERALSEGGVRGRKKKKLVDKVAAALILQSWLDIQ